MIGKKLELGHEVREMAVWAIVDGIHLPKSVRALWGDFGVLGVLTQIKWSAMAQPQETHQLMLERLTTKSRRIVCQQSGDGVLPFLASHWRPWRPSAAFLSPRQIGASRPGTRNRLLRFTHNSLL